MKKSRQAEYRITIFGIIILIAWFFWSSLLLHVAYSVYLPESMRGVVGLAMYAIGAIAVFRACLRRVPSEKVGISEEEWWRESGTEPLDAPEKSSAQAPAQAIKKVSNVIFSDGAKEEVCIFCPRIHKEDVSEVLLKTKDVPAGIPYKVLEIRRLEEGVILRGVPKGPLARKRHEILRNRVRFVQQHVSIWIETSEGWIDLTEKRGVFAG